MIRPDVMEFAANNLIELRQYGFNDNYSARVLVSGEMIEGREAEIYDSTSKPICIDLTHTFEMRLPEYRFFSLEKKQHSDGSWSEYGEIKVVELLSRNNLSSFLQIEYSHQQDGLGVFVLKCVTLPNNVEYKELEELAALIEDGKKLYFTLTERYPYNIQGVDEERLIQLGIELDIAKEKQREISWMYDDSMISLTFVTSQSGAHTLKGDDELYCKVLDKMKDDVIKDIAGVNEQIDVLLQDVADNG